MGSFPTTRWSLILAADLQRDDEARAAMAALCEAYWQPLYSFVRGSGHSADGAQDLVQGFFASFLSRNYLDLVDRDRGRFRSYLLGALKHHIADQKDRARALKRGGGVADLPLEIDFPTGERRFLDQASGEPDPEKLYERRWALSVLDRVLERLRDRYERAGQLDRYRDIVPFVTGDHDSKRYREVGEQLGLSESTVKVSVHRMRRRFFDALRDEIASTVSSDEEIEGEMRHLLKALSA